MVSALQIRTFVKGKYFTHAHFNVEPQILTFLVHITTYVGSITSYSIFQDINRVHCTLIGHSVKYYLFYKTSGISFG